MLSNHVYGLELIFGLLVCQIVFFLPLSLERSSPLPGYCDESTRSALASPLTSVLYFSIFVLGCVYSHCWRPPITIKAQLHFLPLCREFPCYCFCYGNRCFFSPWALHVSNQSETSVEIPRDPLIVFNLYHHGSIHCSFNKRGKNSSPQPGMTSKIGVPGFLRR